MTVTTFRLYVARYSTLLLSVLAFMTLSCTKNDSGPSPSVTSLSVSLASVGRTVIITGNNFSAVSSENIVMFNGTPAVVTASSTTQLTTTVPQGATTGKITVNVKGATGTGPVFTVYTPGNITSITPYSGPPGTVITITGTGFETGTANLTAIFTHANIPTAIPITSSTPTEIKITVPTGIANATGFISIKAFGTETYTAVNVTPGITAGDVSIFTIAGYTVTGCSPRSGKVGSTVTISGLNFSPNISDNYVVFQTATSLINATITNVTSTQLTATVPSIAVTGIITVSSDNFSTLAYVHDLFVITP